MIDKIGVICIYCFFKVFKNKMLNFSFKFTIKNVTDVNLMVLYYKINEKVIYKYCYIILMSIKITKFNNNSIF